LLESSGANPSDPPLLQPPNRDNGIVRAAVILAIGNVASRLLGLVREAVKADLFGASGALAAFEAAALVPTTLFDLIIGGIVSSALVPVFSDYVTDKERRDELWLAVSTVLSVVTVILLLVVAFVELLTPQIAGLVGAHRFKEEGLTAMSIRLMRLTTPAVLFLSISSILTGVLVSLKRFTLPAFTAATFNGSMVVIVLLHRQIEGLVWGLLAGSLLQVAIQLPALRDARLRWRHDWRHPAIGRIMRLYLPIVVGLMVDQVARALSYNLAIRTGDASLTYMRWATTLIQFPLGLVVTALSLAILPTLSQQANDSLQEFKRSLAGGIRLVTFLIMPATAGLFALSTPIVALLFEHGAFTHQDTLTTALVLRVYLVGLPFAAVDQMLVFASYARKDTWRPALVGVISILIYSIVALLLLKPMGLLSLMVADASKHVVHTLLMAWLLRRRLGGLPGYGLGAASLKAIGASLVTGFLAGGAAWLVDSSLPLAAFAGKLFPVAVAGVVGVLAYTGLSLCLNIPEARTMPQQLFNRRRH
jgi:putative peptidoglycan lipid II flippase